MKKYLVALGLLLLATVAQAAITVTPDAGILNFSRWEINDNSTLTTAEVAAIVSPASPILPLYKATPGIADEGLFATSYATTFNGDVSGGLVDYISGPFINTSQVYLLVKDGNEDPSQYIFRISSFTIPGGPWDGTEDIILSGFWPDQGSISHISIYGGGPPGTPDPQDVEPPAVPEPASLAIWGLMAIGGVMYRRRLSTGKFDAKKC